MRSWVGFRQTGMVIDRPGRHAGRSKYTPIKLFKLAMDGIFAFSIVPLRVALFCGMLAVMASLAYAVYAIFARLMFEKTPQGFASTIVAMVFLAGVQLLVLGVIGEYVGRIYEEVKGRPHYIVQKVVRNGGK